MSILVFIKILKKQLTQPAMTTNEERLFRFAFSAVFNIRLVYFTTGVLYTIYRNELKFVFMFYVLSGIVK